MEALDLVPLGLEDMGMWDPKEEYWGEEGEPIEEWTKPIIARGPRPMFEMEQVLPGEDPDDPFNDPITRSNDLKDAGERAEAVKILMELCQATCAASIPIRIWAISSLITVHKMPFDIMKSVCASANSPWETTLMACCRGAISTTACFCAACTAMDCVSGVLGALTRRSAFSIGCFG